MKINCLYCTDSFNNNLYFISGLYDQFMNLNLPHLDLLPGPRWRNFFLVLAYKSLDSATDHRLIDGWLRWSGAWLAYCLLLEKGLPVTNISL